MDAFFLPEHPDSLFYAGAAAIVALFTLLAMAATAYFFIIVLACHPHVKAWRESRERQLLALASARPCPLPLTKTR